MRGSTARFHGTLSIVVACSIWLGPNAAKANWQHPCHPEHLKICTYNGELPHLNPLIVKVVNGDASCRYEVSYKFKAYTTDGASCPCNPNYVCDCGFDSTWDGANWGTTPVVKWVEAQNTTASGCWLRICTSGCGGHNYCDGRAQSVDLWDAVLLQAQRVTGCTIQGGCPYYPLSGVFDACAPDSQDPDWICCSIGSGEGA